MKAKLRFKRLLFVDARARYRTGEASAAHTAMHAPPSKAPLSPLSIHGSGRFMLGRSMKPKNTELRFHPKFTSTLLRRALYGANLMSNYPSTATNSRL